MESESDYFLLFGRQLSRGGGTSEVWVEVRLPEVIFEDCPERANNLGKRVKESINLSDIISHSAFSSEIEIMALLASLKDCEICDNGTDDNGDGLVDCEDLDCLISSLGELRSGLPARTLNACPVLTEAETLCLLEHKAYFREIGIYDTETALMFCTELQSLLEDEEGEVPLMQNGVEVNDISVPSSEIVPGRLLGYTDYVPRHNPPVEIAPDMLSRTDGDSSLISWKCRSKFASGRSLGGQPTWEEYLEGVMLDLLDFATTGGYKNVADRFMQRFISGVGGTYEDHELSSLISNTNELRNKLKMFGKVFENRLKEKGGDYDSIETIYLDRAFRTVFSRANGYLLKGPTILINDVSEVKYYLQSCFIDDSDARWHAVFLFEVTDHFGLDDADINHTVGNMIRVRYQDLHCGFAAWWGLQHRFAYLPFITKMRFVVSLSGNL